MFCLFILILIWATISFGYSLLSCNPWMLFLWIPLGLITTIVLFIAWIYLVVVPVFKKVNPSSKFKARYASHIMKFAILICGSKMKVEGIENLTAETKTLYVANHKSLLDPLFIYVAVKRSLTAAGKAELFKVSILKPLIKAFHIIKIDRSSDREAAKGIVEGIKYMKGGHGVIIFPEGGIKTREVEQMVSIKPGAYKLATKSDAVIQPIAIIGSSKISKRKLFSKFVKVTVRILPAITPEDYRELNTHEIAYKVLDAVNSNFIHEGKYEIEEEN